MTTHPILSGLGTTLRILIGLLMLPYLLFALLIPPLGVNLIGWVFRK